MPTALCLWQHLYLLLVLPHGLAGQGCGEQKTFPVEALTLLGQALMAPGGLTGVLGHEQMGKDQWSGWGWGKGKVQAGTRRPGKGYESPDDSA